LFQNSWLNPNDNQTPKYAQLYVYDSNMANDNRMRTQSNIKLERELLVQLDTLLREINPYAEAYRLMKDVEIQSVEKIGMAIVNERGRPGSL
jgi:hypothetical protein